MAIKISLVSDVEDALRGSAQVADSFEKVQDSLDDVATTGKETGTTVADAMTKAGASVRPTNSEFRQLANFLETFARNTGRDLPAAFEEVKRAARETGTEIEQGTLDALERISRQGPRDVDKLKDALRQLEQQADDTGDELGDSMRDGTRRASDAVDGFKDESSSSMREAAASFDGSAESIQDVFQEISANALASFGPAGAIAGLAVATGAGALFTYLNSQAEKTKERLQEAFQDMVDNASGAFSQGFIEGQLANIFSGADEAVVSLEKLTNVSKESGVSVDLLARAYAGDMSAMEEATIQLQRKISDDSAVLGYEAAMSTATGHTLRDLEKQRNDWDSTTSRVEGYERAIRGIPNTAHTRVDVTDNDSARRTKEKIRDLSEYAGLKRDVTLGVRASTAQASIDVANWRHAQQSIPVQIGMRAV